MILVLIVLYIGPRLSVYFVLVPIKRLLLRIISVFLAGLGSLANRFKRALPGCVLSPGLDVSCAWEFFRQMVQIEETISGLGVTM